MPRLGKAKVQEIDPLQRAREALDTSQGDYQPDTQESVLQQRLKTIPIERIRPGRYQTRQKIDEPKYRQLLHQIQTEGFRHILIVCQDPEDRSYYHPMMGGHLRLKAAQEAGVKEILAFVEDYDQMRLGKGTAFENQGRQDLNIVEKGKLFSLFQQDFGWTQETIAKELAVEGGRDHVARCLLAAESAPDIQAMLMEDSDRGLRVLTYLRQLDVLDEGDGNESRAAQARAPIIDAFLNRRLSTDGVKIAVENILHAREAHVDSAPPLNELYVRRMERITSTRKSWRRALKELGEDPLTEAERAELFAFRAEIDAVLNRG